MAQNAALQKQYSGWVLVAAGLIVGSFGIIVTVILAAMNATVVNDRLVSLLIVSLPVGVVLIIIGLVHVIRHRPVIDDSARHAQFEALNRRLLHEQRIARRTSRHARHG